MAPKPLPDVLGRDMVILFCGINPSLRSAAAGHHFARPGNRFWPALHLAGITPERFTADRDVELPALGYGLTNLVDRPTRAADELTREELRTGAAALERLVIEWRPRLLAVVGVTAYRGAFGRPDARLGLRAETVGGRPLWVLPNPSGLNAHHQLPELAARFRAAREHAERSVCT